MEKKSYNKQKQQQQRVKKPSYKVQNSSSGSEEEIAIETASPAQQIGGIEYLMSELKIHEYADQGSGSKGKDITLVAKPEFEAVTTEKINMYGMASLVAPVRVGKAARVPIDLVVVVDTSGSMSGERISLLKVTTKFVVNNLNKDDYYSLVQYNSSVSVEQPLTAMSKVSVSELERQISSLNAGGGTDLCGGLVEGCSVAAQSKSENKVSAVLLLTDGHATTVRNPTTIVSKFRKVLGNKACSIFCFGFGTDHDGTFLKKIADDGAGSYYFIEKEADIDTSFGDCLGGLISVACQKMILTIEPLNGVTIKKVLGSKPTKPQPSGSGKTAAPVQPVTPHPQKKVQIDDDDEECVVDAAQLEEQKLRDLEEQKKLEIEEAAPGKETPEYLFLGDFYSEESRDIVFHLQLPVHPEPTPEFIAARVNLNYFNVITEKFDKVSGILTVKRSPEIPVIQRRDFSLDLQINRLMAAAAMEEAQTKECSEAKTIVTKAIARLKASISADDHFTQSLIADLQEILADMKDTTSFQKVAVAKMAWMGDAHKKQRAAGNAGTSYQTSEKRNMQEKAKAYSKPYSDKKSKK